MTPDLTYFGLALVSGFILDFLYARYVLGVAEKRRLVAALYSSGIGAAGFLGISAILASGFPAFLGYVLGLGLGTFVGVSR